MKSIPNSLKSKVGFQVIQDTVVSELLYCLVWNDTIFWNLQCKYWLRTESMLLNLISVEDPQPYPQSLAYSELMTPVARVFLYLHVVSASVWRMLAILPNVDTGRHQNHFLPTWPKPRHISVEECLYQIGPWACLWGVAQSTVGHDSFEKVDPGHMRKLSTVSNSVPASMFLPWLPALVTLHDVSWNKPFCSRVALAMVFITVESQLKQKVCVYKCAATAQFHSMRCARPFIIEPQFQHCSCRKCTVEYNNFYTHFKRHKLLWVSRE